MERKLLTRIGLEEDFINNLINEAMTRLEAGVGFTDEDAASLLDQLTKLKRVICAMADLGEAIDSISLVTNLRDAASGLKDVAVIAIDLSILFGDGGLVTLATSANSVRSGITSLAPKVERLWGWFRRIVQPEDEIPVDEQPEQGDLTPEEIIRERRKQQQKARQLLRRYLGRTGGRRPPEDS